MHSTRSLRAGDQIWLEIYGTNGCWGATDGWWRLHPLYRMVVGRKHFPVAVANNVELLTVCVQINTENRSNIIQCLKFRDRNRLWRHGAITFSTSYIQCCIQDLKNQSKCEC